MRKRKIKRDVTDWYMVVISLLLVSISFLFFKYLKIYIEVKSREVTAIEEMNRQNQESWNEVKALINENKE